MATALQIVKHFHPEVTTVKDAKRNVRIEVLPRDTSLATVKNHKTCAMAVACKRRFHLDGVIISVNTAYLVKGKTATRFKLPNSVSREVVSFDRKAGFAAGQYQLNAPTPGNALNQHRGKSTSSENSDHKNTHKRFSHYTTDIRTSLKKMED
jgi:hypothetical protein